MSVTASELTRPERGVYAASASVGNRPVEPPSAVPPESGLNRWCENIAAEVTRRRQLTHDAPESTCQRSLPPLTENDDPRLRSRGAQTLPEFGDWVGLELPTAGSVEFKTEKLGTEKFRPGKSNFSVPNFSVLSSPTQARGFFGVEIPRGRLNRPSFPLRQPRAVAKRCAVVTLGFSCHRRLPRAIGVFTQSVKAALHAVPGNPLRSL